MEALVNEDEVVTSSADTRRESSGANEGVVTGKLDGRKAPLSLPVRTLNGAVVYTPVSIPVSSSGTIKGNQTIAVPQHGGAVSIVQLLPNQTNVVQSVIQPPNQQSVIQAAGSGSVQTLHLSKNLILLNKVNQGSVIQSTESNEINPVLIPSARTDPESVITPNIVDDEPKKRREGFTRRPSYRRILHDLSSVDVSSVTTIPEIKSEEESQEIEPETSAITASPSYPKVLSASAIHLAGSQDSLQGIPTLTMTNAPTSGDATVHYTAQGQDGQCFVPVTAPDLQTYQIRPNSDNGSGLSPDVVMNAANITSAHSTNAEEQAKKREIRLQKNREAAKECRRKKKEYIKCLETRVALLEKQNKALITELTSLKNLFTKNE